MTRDLSRLLKPRAIAVIGGGAWCASIVGAVFFVTPSFSR